MMHPMGPAVTLLIVVAVLLFFFLGIALVVIIDHKARLPGGFTSNPFSIRGLHRDHPYIAFLTTVILVAIILALIFELVVTILGQFEILAAPEPPKLLAQISEERATERIRRFHNPPEQTLSTMGEKTVCFFCHGDFPHSKEPMVRTLLNMHSQFIGCMTCHVDPNQVPEQELTFRWVNYSGIEVQGRPFGIDVESESGDLIRTDDYYSKIVPYRNDDKLLEITPDVQEAKDFAEVHGQLSDADRELVKKRFHKLVADKGPFCDRCHTQEPDSYMPFRQLGFSNQRIDDLTNLNILGLIEKYEEFYLPSMLRPEAAAGQTPEAKAETPAIGSDMRKDPRAWWRETYDDPEAKDSPNKDSKPKQNDG